MSSVGIYFPNFFKSDDGRDTAPNDLSPEEQNAYGRALAQMEMVNSINEALVCEKNQLAVSHKSRRDSTIPEVLSRLCINHDFLPIVDSLFSGGVLSLAPVESYSIERGRSTLQQAISARRPVSNNEATTAVTGAREASEATHTSARPPLRVIDTNHLIIRHSQPGSIDVQFSFTPPKTGDPVRRLATPKLFTIRRKPVPYIESPEWKMELRRVGPTLTPSPLRTRAARRTPYTPETGINPRHSPLVYARIFPSGQLRRAVVNGMGPLGTTDSRAQVNIDSFLLSHLLGAGAQGKVYLAKPKYLKRNTPTRDLCQPLIDESDFIIANGLPTSRAGSPSISSISGAGPLYAIKFIEKKKIRENTKFLFHEQRILRRTKGHPFLVEMIASFHDFHNFYIVTDYHGGGDLQKALEEGVLCTERVRLYAAEIASGIHYLHKNNVIHRDIKPANILLKENGHIAIADFGLAKVFDGDWLGRWPDNSRGRDPWVRNGLGPHQTKGCCGTPHYMSPEVACGKPYSFEADWWSFGVTLFCLLEGQVPWHYKDFGALKDAICRHPLPWGSGSSVDADAADLVERILHKKREQRLSAAQIISHSFFVMINWCDLESLAIEPPFRPRSCEPFLPPCDKPKRHAGRYIFDPYPNFYYADCELEEAQQPAHSPPTVHEFEQPPASGRTYLPGSFTLDSGEYHQTSGDDYSRRICDLHTAWQAVLDPDSGVPQFIDDIEEIPSIVINSVGFTIFSISNPPDLHSIQSHQIVDTDNGFSGKQVGSVCGTVGFPSGALHVQGPNFIAVDRDDITEVDPITPFKSTAENMNETLVSVNIGDTQSSNPMHHNLTPKTKSPMRGKWDGIVNALKQLKEGAIRTFNRMISCFASRKHAICAV